MKVLALNGSPRKNGNTYQALSAMRRILALSDIETEIVQLGDKAVRGCIACGSCAKTGICALADEEFTQITEKMVQADGLILGSPVYYAGINGTLKAFLDRAFYVNGSKLRHKVGCAVAVARRSGGMPTFQQLNNYFLISEMVVAPSYYWNTPHGSAPGDVLEDDEGMSIVKNLAQNMAWLLQMKQATAATLPPPKLYPRQYTDFVRSSHL